MFLAIIKNKNRPAETRTGEFTKFALQKCDFIRGQTCRL